MPNNNSKRPQLSPQDKALLSKLQADFPEFRFQNGDSFTFHPPKTIILGPPQPNFALLTLHELSHAILKHKDYEDDVQLIKIESRAWQEAKILCKTYTVNWDEDFAQNKLDSYRDWLHQRSLCPNCLITGYQDQRQTYHCPLCHRIWNAKY